MPCPKPSCAISSATKRRTFWPSLPAMRLRFCSARCSCSPTPAAPWSILPMNSPASTNSSAAPSSRASRWWAAAASASPSPFPPNCSRRGASIGCRNELLFQLPHPEPVLMFHHVHPLPPETHAFHFQTRALLQPRLILQLDRAARTHHALPRQRPARSEERRVWKE